MPRPGSGDHCLRTVRMNRNPRLFPAAWLLGWMMSLWTAVGGVQVDLFAGYDGVVRAGSWFPVTVEVFNDGGTVEGHFEVSGGRLGSQGLRFREQLPGGTRKRFHLPLFAASRNASEISVRLADSRGRTLAEKAQTVQAVSPEVPILGAIPEGVSGMPRFPEPRDAHRERIPTVGRLDTAYLPDNALALEGLTALYLNIARAGSIPSPQAEALLAWLNGGGHLILALEQIPDLAASRWLRPLLPLVPNGSELRNPGSALEAWLRSGPARPTHAGSSPEVFDDPSRRKDPVKNPVESARYFQDLAPDPAVTRGETPVVTGRMTPGAQVVASVGGTPLILTRSQGRGRVTLLTFNPEREPVKSWKWNRAFWAALTGVPPPLLADSAWIDWGTRSLDAVFASMIETRQVRKLPVGILLLLLVVYLGVIGPFDRWLVRRLGRPMLTWITFPGYVAVFSLLIYWIGFKLRAGQTEWTELHIVDVLPMPGTNAGVGLRGRTYTSLYSPANSGYSLRLSLPSSAFRPEYDGFGTVAGEARLTFSPGPDSCDAEVFVPVWTSQLNIAEWTGSDLAPLEAGFVSGSGRRKVRVRNLGNQSLSKVWVVSSLGVSGPWSTVPPGDTLDIAQDGAVSIQDFVRPQLGQFQSAADDRRQVFGNSAKRTSIDDWSRASVAASLVGSQVQGPDSIPDSANRNGFRNAGLDRRLAPTQGLDLSASVARGDTQVFAWVEDHSPVAPIHRFEVTRTRRATLYRITVPEETVSQSQP